MRRLALAGTRVASQRPHHRALAFAPRLPSTTLLARLHTTTMVRPLPRLLLLQGAGTLAVPRPAGSSMVRRLCSQVANGGGGGGATPPALPPKRWTPAWMWKTVKETATHYYHGSKLLAADTRIAARLLRKLFFGRTLTRREHNLLVRVCADIVRLVPLSFFVIVPVAEVLLPLAITLFPNLLPSTFEERHQKEEKRKKLLKVRLEMTQLLEDTLEERAAQVVAEEKSKKRKQEEMERREKEGEGEGGGAGGGGDHLQISLMETQTFGGIAQLATAHGAGGQGQRHARPHVPRAARRYGALPGHERVRADGNLALPTSAAAQKAAERG
jgi:hypothetical protein